MADLFADIPTGGKPEPPDLFAGVPVSGDGIFDDIEKPGEPDFFGDIPTPEPPPEQDDSDRFLSLNVVTSMRRIAETAGGFATRSLEEGGIGFQEEAEEFFALLLDPSNSQALARLNRAVLEGPVIAFDLVLAGIRAGLGGFEQIMLELGVPKTDAKKIRRDANAMIDTLAFVSGSVPGSPRATVKAPPKTNAQAIMQEAVAKAAPENQAAMAAEATRVLGALETAKAKIGTQGLEEVSSGARFTFGNRVATEIVDNLRTIKILARRGAKEKGIPADLTPYRDMRLLAGSRGVVEAVMKRGTIERTAAGDIIFNGKGFNDVFAPVAGDLQNMGMYFAGRRAKELAAQGREKLFTLVEIDAMVGLEKINPKFKEVFDDWISFNKRMVDFGESSGLISSAQKQAYLDAGQSFVPFYRVIDDALEGSKVQGSIFKRLKGGTANVNELLDNMARNTAMWVDHGLRNHAKAQVYRMVDDLGFSNVAVRVGPEVQFVKVIDKEINAQLKGMGLDLGEKNVQALAFNKRVGDRFDFYMKDGKRIFYEIKDPLFLKTMLSMNPRSIGLGMRVAGGFKTVLTRLVTASPDFMLRNGLRDTQAAFVQSQANFIPLVDSIRGMRSRMIKDENYWTALANGGGFSTLYKGEVGIARDIRSFYSGRGLNYDLVLDTPRKIMAGVEEVSSAFEMAARLSEFKKVSTKTGSRREGAFSMREVSTDFAMRGASDFIQNLMAVVPFLNARMQGVVRLGREAKNHPAKVAVRGLTALTFPALGLYFYNKNDPRYDALPDWVKDLHMVVFVPGKEEPFLIPKGFEYGAIFQTIPERMMQAIELKNGRIFADSMLRIIMDSLGFNPIPQVVRPMVEQFANRSLFTFNPIIPVDLEGIRTSEQFRPWTSETMVALSQGMSKELGIEVSPIRAEALVRGYFGTLGMYALDMADFMVRSFQDKGEAPTLRPDEMPLVKSFIRSLPLRDTRFEHEFYDLLGEARMAATTVTKMVREARKPELRKGERAVFPLRKPLERVASSVALVNRAIRLIQDDPKLSAETKRRRIDNLRKQRNDVFEKTLRQVPEKILLERGIEPPVEADKSEGN